jgi:hypothetical protein
MRDYPEKIGTYTEIDNEMDVDKVRVDLHKALFANYRSNKSGACCEMGKDRQLQMDEPNN